MEKEANVDISEELKLHRESIETSSPLLIVREKELEIRSKIMESQRKAEEIVAEARRKAAAIKDKALVEGPKEAQEYADAELKKIEEEAAKIRTSAASEIGTIKEAGARDFEKAVNKIVGLLIP